MKRRIILFVSLISVMTTLLSACSSTTTQENDQTTGGKLRILSENIGGKTPEEDKQFVAEVKRLTGIELILEKPASDYDQKLLTAISSGEKYDLIEVSNMPQYGNFIKQGVASDLTDFIKNSKVLSDPKVMPTKEWDVLKSDDKIYAVYAKFQGGTMPNVRKDWLEKLGLQEPKTLDDYYNVMKAFKEKDPDGNGKADTYGISTAGIYDIQGFMSAAGLKYRYVMKDGKRTIPYASDAAIPMYEWFAKLTKEGLMDPNFITNDTAKMRDLLLNDRVGFITYWDGYVGILNGLAKQKNPNTTFNLIGLPAVPGPDGKSILRRGDPDFWILPTNAEHKDVAKRFLEFWQTEPGIILGSLGVEGVDYKKNGDKYELTEQGKNHNMDHGQNMWYNTTVARPFGYLQGHEAAKKIIEKDATLELALPTWDDAEKIVENYVIKAMAGQIPAKDAVKKMQEELKSANLIDE